jgi:hypothetical protein
MTARVEQQDPQQRRRAAAEPVRQSEHQRERRERREPRHRDIGFPAARSREERELGGAEMPEVVVGHRDAGSPTAPKNGLPGGNPSRVISSINGGLGVVEDRRGERDSIDADLGHDRHRGSERQHAAPR